MAQDAPPANELERRKHVKLLLRRDLEIEAQRYEGKIFYVVKDPISLRYYRLKDSEYFLLEYFDGKHTLEEAQKAYEKRFRPDRLKLEDLEAFGQQLLKAGLAQNESPKAGKQLFENRKKRIRMEWIQVFTNILYIKIPILDPDVLLGKMLKPLGWLFSAWFFALSVGVMMAAIMLVATHFTIFRSKLPDYHQFFTFGTVVNLWIALGCVKVIHEFGHGLSCKRFGGEVHEMGALFLCLSPALYCNVSDAWTLPSKWHRIIISAAGIYVELLIAAISTFVWWNTAAYPFINNLSLSLMVVCSVSTIVFNANPLMRYDGYYVLADLLEIPNLRERSNRFLKNTVLEHCLGVEVQPEPYMALWRKVLFITYAIISYIYRWVVTFGILWFLYSFLRPYKLEVISSLLTLLALGSLVGWPLYRLGKNLHKRGRLPDMKRWRVLASTSVLLALALFLCLVPVPVSRVRGVGLVEPQAETSDNLFVRHKGILKELNVRPGDRVKRGDVVAVFREPEVEDDLTTAKSEREVSQAQLELLEQQFRDNTDTKERTRIASEQAKARGKVDEAETKIAAFRRVLEEELVLRAPRDGMIGQAPRVDQIGQEFKPDGKVFFSVYEPSRLRIALPLVTSEFNRLKQDLERLSEKARNTTSSLSKKVSLECKDERLADVLARLEGQVKGLKLWLDTEHGAKPDLPVSYRSGRRRLKDVLSDLFEKTGLGYVVLSEPDGEHDGWVQVRQGRERGDPEGGRPLQPLPITLRVQGRDRHTWEGRIVALPQSEARTVPLLMSNKAAGPVAVRSTPPPTKEAKQAQRSGTDPLVPTTQHYIVYVEVLNPDGAMLAGQQAQVKIRCQPETCLHWAYRTIHDLFDLGLW